MHFKKLHLAPALAFAFALVLLIAGCSKDEVEEIVGVCPIVLSTVPEDGDINVPLDQVITVTFTAPVNPATINGQTIIVSNGSTSVAGTVTYSGTTATFTPSANLLPNTTYTGTVTTGVKDPIGNAMQRNYVWSFTTIPEVTLSASPETGGSVTGAGTFNKGSQVTVIATPNEGFSFINWTEGEEVVSTSASYEFTMNGNRNLVANFAVSTYTLNVTAVNGTVSKAPAQDTYTHGATVVLTATPAQGYRFAGWEGDATGSENPLTVTMNSNKNITAIFTAITYSLNVTAQNGTVSKTPNQTTFNSGATVVLNATPATGYRFSGWSGDASGSTNPLTVTMNSNKNITANFTLIPVTTTYTLKVTAVNGTVSKTPIQTTYASGTQVVLRPTAATGYQFTGWSGDANGTANPLTVNMNSNKNITANFTLIPVSTTYTLNVTAVNGTVSKTPNQTTYASGAQVVLRPTAANGYQFTGWSGDETGSANPLTVTMNSNKNITANFTQIPVVGQICPNPAVDLGLAKNYAILAKSGISTTGTTAITGHLGVSPITSTAITGFGLILSSDGTYSSSNLVTGRVYASNYTTPTPENLGTAVRNMETAFTTANGLAPDR
ncbi:MAG TPA: Ig-like domain-containing protein, partial [Gillisia sp.]|nr:Ig-like domain-containing protein [Gillisia sp.]